MQLSAPQAVQSPKNLQIVCAAAHGAPLDEVSDAHHHHGAAAPHVLVRHCFFWVRTSAGDARIHHMQTLRSGKHRRPRPKDRAVAASPRYRAGRRQNWPARRRARRNSPPIEPWRTAIRALVPVRCAQRDVWSPAMATTVASFWPLLVPGLAQVHVVHGMSRDGRAPSTWRKKHQTPSRRFLENHPAPRVRQHPPRARADATSVISF